MHDSNQPAPKDGLAVQFMEFDGEVYDKESITMETLDKMIRFIMTRARRPSSSLWTSMARAKILSSRPTLKTDGRPSRSTVGTRTGRRICISRSAKKAARRKRLYA